MFACAPDEMGFEMGVGRIMESGTGKRERLDGNLTESQ